MNRRDLLARMGSLVLAPLLAPELTHAAAQLEAGAASGVDWSLAFADLDADVPASAMTRITGRCPDGLAGALYRNGPGKFRRAGGDVGHWFDGDGLMRALPPPRWPGDSSSPLHRYAEAPGRHPGRRRCHRRVRHQGRSRIAFTVGRRHQCRQHRRHARRRPFVGPMGGRIADGHGSHEPIHRRSQDPTARHGAHALPRPPSPGARRRHLESRHGGGQHRRLEAGVRRLVALRRRPEAAARQLRPRLHGHGSASDPHSATADPGHEHLAVHRRVYLATGTRSPDPGARQGRPVEASSLRDAQLLRLPLRRGLGGWRRDHTVRRLRKSKSRLRHPRRPRSAARCLD